MLAKRHCAWTDTPDWGLREVSKSVLYTRHARKQKGSAREHTESGGKKSPSPSGIYFVQ